MASKKRTSSRIKQSVKVTSPYFSSNLAHNVFASKGIAIKMKKLDFEEISVKRQRHCSSSNSVPVVVTSEKMPRIIKTERTNCDTVSTMKTAPYSTDSFSNVISKDTPQIIKTETNDFDDSFNKCSGHSVETQSTQKCIDSSTNTIACSRNLMDDFMSTINKVRSLKLMPPVYIYYVKDEGHGLSAVDVNLSKSHIAYSYADSCEINLVTWDDYSDAFIGNVTDTFLEYLATEKLQNTKEKGFTENLPSPQMFLIKHAAAVSDLCFSSNNNILLSCALDGSVKVFCTNTYRILQCYDDIGYFPKIAVSSDAAYFAISSVFSRSTCKNVTSLYNLEKKEPFISLLGHTDSIKCVKFHPNGLYIATASCDKTIKLWSTHTSKEVRQFQDETSQDHPEKLAFSPDGKYLASTYSGSVLIWDLASGKKLKSLDTSNSELDFLSICYNDSGSVLAAGGLRKNLYFWNVESHGSSVANPDYELMKYETLNKRIFSVKYTRNCFTCVTA